MPLELRCSAKLHGVLIEEGQIEVKCGSRFCGAKPGVVVIHRFDLHTGGVETRRYQEPPKPGRR